MRKHYAPRARIVSGFGGDNASGNAIVNDLSSDYVSTASDTDTGAGSAKPNPFSFAPDYNKGVVGPVETSKPTFLDTIGTIAKGLIGNNNTGTYAQQQAAAAASAKAAQQKQQQQMLVIVGVVVVVVMIIVVALKSKK